MSLNRFMHPRSPYFNNTPDFLKLSENNSNLKKYLDYDEKKKKYSIDFYNPNALKEICCALLKETFSKNILFIFFKFLKSCYMNFFFLIKRLGNRSTNRPSHSTGASTRQLLSLD